MNQATPAELISGSELELLRTARRLYGQDAVLGKLDEVAGLLKAPVADAAAFIDPLAPQIVLLGEDGKPLPAGSNKAEAILLPQYRRMFDIAVTKATSWQSAKEAAGSCRALGFTDWYLPDAKELELLVSRTRIQPATYPELVPFTRFDDWYWSSTEYPSDSSIACSVRFSYGLVDWYGRGGHGLVRACRAVPASQ